MNGTEFLPLCGGDSRDECSECDAAFEAMKAADMQRMRPPDVLRIPYGGEG